MNTKDLKEHIDSLAGLKEGWYDPHEELGSVISPEVIERAKNIISELPGDGWYVYPMLSGGIEFEHDDGDSLMVDPDGQWTVMVTTSNLNLSILDALKGYD